MGCCCESQECRFESADTFLNITFMDGRNEIDAYWESLPRVGESVSVDSLIENETAVIAGAVTAVQWRQVRGIYGNPIVLIGVDGFDLQSVRVVIDKERQYRLEWDHVPPQTETKCGICRATPCLCSSLRRNAMRILGDYRSVIVESLAQGGRMPDAASKDELNAH
jgi:hypothetical protein